MKIFHITKRAYIISGIIIGLIFVNLFMQNYMLSAKVKVLEETIKLIIDEYDLQSSTIQQCIRSENPALPERLVIEVSKYIICNARRSNFDPLLLTSLCRVESSFVPTAVSKANARGLFQVQPGTFGEVHTGDIDNMKDNIEAGTRYLNKLLHRFKNLRIALAAYNCGPSRPADRIWEISGGYANKVLDGWQQLQNRRKELSLCYYSDRMRVSKAVKSFTFYQRPLPFICNLNAVQTTVKRDLYQF